MITCKNFVLFNILIVFVISSFSCKKVEIKIMKVRNDSISDISYTTAKAHATIIDVGNGIEQHGHCWSTSVENLNIDNETFTEKGQANKTGPYNSVFGCLLPNTKYYVRAYVRDGSTVVYGDDILAFTTLSVSIPVVTTGAVTDVTTSGATVKGSLSSLGAGASAVTQHGHCWSSETTTPTIEDNSSITSFGYRNETGSFESKLVGLSENTTYYVRAYAMNDAGTGYGEPIGFTTISKITAEFNAEPKTGYVPLSVQFTDMSTGEITSWSWHFGDGESSVSQNPFHTYDNQGIYSVTLVVSNNNDSDSETKNNYIIASTSGVAPIAAFIADKTLITEGETVNFTDQSINVPTSWSWNFGDGETSPSQNPSHQYNTEGTYSVTLTATNNYGSDSETKTNYITVQSVTTETVSDIDGNTYQTVEIGSQWWMAENLKTTRYNDGTAIPLVTDYSEWTGLSTDGYCWYDNNQIAYKNTYGALYNWHTVNMGKLCPVNWHVPSDNDWNTLIDFLGGSSAAGGKLKETGTAHWINPNTDATNQSGFTGLPGGHRKSDGTFADIGFYANWWTSTEATTSNSYHIWLEYESAKIYMSTPGKRWGFSIRCVKD